VCSEHGRGLQPCGWQGGLTVDLHPHLLRFLDLLTELTVIHQVANHWQWVWVQDICLWFGLGALKRSRFRTQQVNGASQSSKYQSEDRLMTFALLGFLFLLVGFPLVSTITAYNSVYSYFIPSNFSLWTTYVLYWSNINSWLSIFASVCWAHSPPTQSSSENFRCSTWYSLEQL
jgi:hypothetical protein